MPDAPRYASTWTGFHGGSGEVQGAFGSVSWAQGREQWDVRPGHVIDHCLESNDEEEGIDFQTSGIEVSGPAAGSETFDDLTDLYLGRTRVPVGSRLTATGGPTIASTGAQLVASVLVGAAGVLLLRRSRNGS